MYRTEGVDAIATVTELRSDASNVINRIREERDHVLIQKNNEPVAVLVDHGTYRKVKEKLEISELSSLAEEA